MIRLAAEFHPCRMPFLDTGAGSAKRRHGALLARGLRLLTVHRGRLLDLHRLLGLGRQLGRERACLGLGFEAAHDRHIPNLSHGRSRALEIAQRYAARFPAMATGRADKLTTGQARDLIAAAVLADRQSLTHCGSFSSYFRSTFMSTSQSQ
jgi:hypothetical protein